MRHGWECIVIDRYNLLESVLILKVDKQIDNTAVLLPMIRSNKAHLIAFHSFKNITHPIHIQISYQFLSSYTLIAPFFLTITCFLMVVRMAVWGHLLWNYYGFLILGMENDLFQFLINESKQIRGNPNIFIQLEIWAIYPLNLNVSWFPCYYLSP